MVGRAGVDGAAPPPCGACAAGVRGAGDEGPDGGRPAAGAEAERGAAPVALAPAGACPVRGRGILRVTLREVELTRDIAPAAT